LPTAEQFSSGRLGVIGNPDDADAKAFILSSEFETQEDEKVVVYTTSILVNIVDNGKSLEVAHDFGVQVIYPIFSLYLFY
jgi:hypothetical protein